MTIEDRRRWNAKWAADRPEEPPAAWLREHAGLLPAGRMLDVAAGRGRNARALLDGRREVVAVDVSTAALSRFRAPGLHPVCMDLDEPGFRDGAFDGIVCVSFLDRRLFPWFRRWLRPGGVLLFDTFLVDQREIGHPRNPEHLLERNELLRRLGDWRVIRYREGEVGDDGERSFRSSAIAIRPG